MFLNENVQFLDVSNSSLTEVQLELTEACLGLSELAGASMQAGYSIAVSLKEGYLNEEEGEAKKDGVFKRVVTAVKAFIRKMIITVKKFVTLIVLKVRNLYKRFVKKEAGMLAPASTLAVAAAADTYIKQLGDIVGKVFSVRSAKDIDALSSRAATTVEMIKKDVTKLNEKVDAELKNKKYAKIAANDFAKLKFVAEGAEGLASELEKNSKNIESQVDSLANAGPDTMVGGTPASQVLSMLKQKGMTIPQITGGINSLLSLIIKLASVPQGGEEAAA